MSGAMFLMLKKSNDRRQREALEAAFKVISLSTGCGNSIDAPSTSLLWSGGAPVQLMHPVSKILLARITY